MIVGTGALKKVNLGVRSINIVFGISKSLHHPHCTATPLTTHCTTHCTAQLLITTRITGGLHLMGQGRSFPNQKKSNFDSIDVTVSASVITVTTTLQMYHHCHCHSLPLPASSLLLSPPSF
jgi:hypothetical protein